MIRLSRLTLVFTLAFVILIVGPAFLGYEFAPYPLMEWGDVLDLLTPLVLIPLYWLLLELRPGDHPERGVTIVFLVLVALWVMGQGMHLVGNSIGHLVEGSTGDVYDLTHFYDEVLSHYLWHFGIIALWALLVYRGWRYPFTGEPAGQGFGIAAGAIHGFNFFLTIVEGATVPMGLPFAILAALFGLTVGRRHWRQQPLLLFFTVTAVVASLFFIGWGIYYGGWPEFSEIGII
jgi:hypothetical protein